VRKSVIALTPLLLVLASCGLFGPETHLAVEMDSTVYGRDSSGNARATFAVHNTGDQDVYFVGCSSPISASVEQRSGSTWSQYLQANVICQANIVPATLVLHPGERYRDVFGWDAPGVYRLRVLYGLSWKDTYSKDALGAAFEFR
jgi:hypothetical protein